MTALYIIGGIILFFVLVFSVPVSVILDYAEKTVVAVKWLFIKIPVVDTSKPKKEKKKKDKKGKKDKDKKEDEKPEEEPETESVQDEQGEQPDSDTEPEKKEEEGKKKKEKKPGNSLIKQLYIDEGYDGIERMLLNVGNALGSFFGKLIKTFTIDEFYLNMSVTGSDAADTAIKYGKLSSWLFPVLGKLASTCKMKKYDIEVNPDFLGKKNEASLYARIHVVPIHITNAAVVLAVTLAFKVLFKILFANQKSKKSRKVNSAPKKGEVKKAQPEKAEQDDKSVKTNIQDKDGVSE